MARKHRGLPSVIPGTCNFAWSNEKLCGEPATLFGYRCEEHGVALQCTAKAPSTQKRCRRRAITGGKVCRKHGGGAPQVQAAAKRRLIELIDPAIAALHKVLTSRFSSDADKIRAAKEVMDRVEGYGPIRNTQHTGKDGGPIKVDASLVGETLNYILSDASSAIALDTVAARAAKAMPVVRKQLKQQEEASEPLDTAVNE